MDKTQLMEKIGTKALQYLDSAELFAKTEVPAYLQEVVKFYAIISLIKITVGILVIIAGFFTFKRIIDLQKDDNSKLGDHTKETISIVGSIMTLTFMCLGIALVCGNFEVAVKTITAPRVFLIDYFRGKE